ncbi:MAG: glycosyltransferase family 9 protein [Planctomycetota bacterium]
MGDVLHALPVLSALRAHWPAAHLTWAVEDRAASLLLGRSDLDRVIVFPRRALAAAARRSPGAGWRALREFLGELRGRRGFDAALDLQGNLKSGLVTRASGAPLRVGPGRREGRELNHLFLTRRVPVPAGARHRVERNLALASALAGRRLAWRDPGFERSPAAAAAADALLAAAGRAPTGGYVLVHPGTSGFGQFKRWPIERFGAFVRRLVADGHDVVATAGPGEEGLVREVLAASGTGAALLVPPDLTTLAELQSRARLVVAPDTGPLHLAALTGVPVLGLFGPKDPDVYGPYGRRADGTVGTLEVITRDDVACRPCTLRRCDLPLCMTTLDPDDVLARARKLLAQGA